MGLPLSYYKTLAPFRTAKSGTEQGFPTVEKRAKGALLWIHAPIADDHAVVIEMIERFQETNPDQQFLITTNDNVKPNLPEHCFWQVLPVDVTVEAEAFLTYWRPDVLVWLSGELSPALLFHAARANIPLYLVDTGEAISASWALRWWPGLRRETLRLFSGVLVGDSASYVALKTAGARSECIEIGGVLERAVPVLPCIENERDILAKLLDSRPVWLAAEINHDELEGVLAAHRQVMRRSHRLLLIIVPNDPDHPEEFVRILCESGLDFSQRSEFGEPDPHCQVYLADTEDELGLWYRLSPVSFIGQTLADWTQSGPNPFGAAALGSVVLHGPGIAPHQNAFQRLARAGASQQVAHSSELALAIEALLAPDKAAEMATAAWEISTAGAEVLELVTGLLTAALDRREEVA
ncbi:MAG: 3-deoxy-D-manno-octulosonic acid transferase [Paracoccaceae bacterium]